MMAGVANDNSVGATFVVSGIPLGSVLVYRGVFTFYRNEDCSTVIGSSFSNGEGGGISINSGVTYPINGVSIYKATIGAGISAGDLGDVHAVGIEVFGPSSSVHMFSPSTSCFVITCGANACTSSTVANVSLA